MKYLLLAIILSSCTVTQVVKEPVSELKADWTNEEWTTILANALKSSELATMNITEVCGDKIQFYTMLLSSLARYESNHKPSSKYTEKFADVNGNRVVSRGLLQLSKESVNGSRYRCGITDAEDLHDPKVNLECGVKVAAALIKENGVLYSKSAPWKGLSRYWSPFRNKEKTKVMMNKAKCD